MLCAHGRCRVQAPCRLELRDFLERRLGKVAETETLRTARCRGTPNPRTPEPRTSNRRTWNPEQGTWNSDYLTSFHHSTRCRSRCLKTNTPANPAAKPATCAQNATPPAGSPPVAVAIEPTPLRNCIKNHTPRKKIAGTSMICQKMNSGSRVTMRECG